MTPPSVATARSLLFAPGSEPGKMARALASSADLVILDLEDGVAASAKEEARRLVRETLRDGPARPTAIRVNSGSEADVELVGSVAVDAVVVPKAHAAAIELAGATSAPVIAQIETAQGLRDVHVIARLPETVALCLGNLDLTAELGLAPRPDGAELLLARSLLVLASAAAGLRPPIDGVHTNFRDEAGLAEEVAYARSLGFRAKLCIHPSQIEIVNAGFSVSEEDLAWARALLDSARSAEAAGTGVIAVDGVMFDEAVFKRARRIFAAGAEGGEGQS